MRDGQALDERERSLFHNRRFLNLWLAGSFASTARWLETLVIGVFVLEQTGSAFIVSSMLMLRVLPMALFGMFGAVLANRFDRRQLLIVGLLVTTATSGCIAVLAAAGVLAVWHVGVCAFIAGAVWMLDFPARRTLMGEVAGPGRTGPAMSLDIVAGSATRAIGPIAGGALYQLVDVVGAFALSTALFGVAIVGLLFLKTRDEGQPASTPRLLHQIAGGFRIVRGNDKLIGIFAITIVYNLFAFPFVSLVPVFGSEILDLESFAIGVLASAEGIGALLGALFLAIVIGERLHDPFYVGGVAGYLLLVVVFSLSTNAYLSGALLISIGVASAAFAAMQSALVLLNAPPGGQQQLMGVLSVCIGTGPLGFVHIGWLAETVGTSQAAAIVAIEGLVVMAIVVLRYRAALFRPTTLPSTTST